MDKKNIRIKQDFFPRIFLSKATIGNLKAFKGKNKIELAPMINLIFGKNSSGKSTINQALRLFRQSYGLNKLTPFNYEAPNELRGRGGLDIDVGYSGIVNNGDLKSKIILGAETAIYNNKQDQISKNKVSLNYTYKYVKNFYTGKNLVKERTILSKIHFSNAGGEVTADLTGYKFFQDKSDLGKAIRQGQRFYSGDFFLRQGGQEQNDDSIYKSVYHPYYYTTKFKPENLKFETIDKIFSELEKLDNITLLNFFNEFLKYIKSKKKILNARLKKEKNKKKEPFPVSDFMSHRKAMEPLQRVIGKIRKECKGNLNKQIKLFLEKKSEMFKIFDDQFIDFDEPLNDLIELTKEFENDIIKLINFFKKKDYSKKKFIDFFADDICSKCKNVIFFNGYFMYLPDIKKKKRNTYREQKGENYLISIMSFLISNHPEEYRDVNIFNGYHDRFGAGNSSTMTNIKKTMDKFLVAPGLRQIPKRYFVKGLQTDYVGPSAENLGELLANPAINKETNKWFEKLEIPYKVDIQKSGNYYEIIFLPKNSKIKISSMHVGLGYPLILPFIVQCIIAKNKIILIEEPEVHLHPKIEADLADLIVESSLLRNNQFIIETHSEDFLLRILKSIRQEKLKPEYVSVNYITPSEKNGSTINKISINKFGQYTTPWHDNLFAERRREFSNKK